MTGTQSNLLLSWDFYVPRV